MNRWAYDIASEQLKSLHEEARIATLVRSVARARMARLLTTWAHRLDPSQRPTTSQHTPNAEPTISRANLSSAPPAARFESRSPRVDTGPASAVPNPVPTTPNFLPLLR